MTQRTLAIGDIHGCLKALETLLDAVKPTADDAVITLGDYVDRGPDSRGVIDRILKLAGETQLFPLLGNHEVMMVDTWRDGLRSAWLEFGGKETLESYARGNNEGTFDDVPDNHWDFLTADCAWYHESQNHVFAHAALEPETPLEEQVPLWLFWEKLIPATARPHCSGKTFVCGHTAQRSGQPINLGHTICIDTFVYGEGGWLTCLDVDSGTYWQANQEGESRTGELGEPSYLEQSPGGMPSGETSGETWWSGDAELPDEFGPE